MTPLPTRPRFNPLRLFWLLTAAYGLVLTSALVVRVVIGERRQAVAFLNNNLHLLLILALILLPLCLLARRWRTGALLTPAALTFVTAYAGMFLPQSVSVPPGALRVSLLTYNLHAEAGVLPPLAQVIRDSGADIVLTQETSAPAAAYLDTELAALYPYRAFYTLDDNRFHGRGLLSRFPILEEYAVPVEYPIPVRLQRAVVAIAGQPVTLYNFHAPPTRPIWNGPYNVWPRRQQITDLLALAAEETNPVILAGDFNTTDLDENYRRITASYVDSYREVGWGLGFTGPDCGYDYSRECPAFIPPYHRLDYIFHSPAFIAVEARVWPSSGGSDHRPVYTELALMPENRGDR